MYTVDIGDIGYHAEHATTLLQRDGQGLGSVLGRQTGCRVNAHLGSAQFPRLIQSSSQLHHKILDRYRLFAIHVQDRIDRSDAAEYCQLFWNRNGVFVGRRSSHEHFCDRAFREQSRAL